MIVRALTSAGKMLRRVIDEAVVLAGDIGSIWVRGTWGVSGSLEEVNQGRDLRDKSGRSLLDRILGDGFSRSSAADAAKPDLRRLPKFSKAVAKSGDGALFARGATKKALAGVERALRMELPSVYRAMLESFDGAVLVGGREILFSTETRVRLNAARERGDNDIVVIGRNLQMYPNPGRNGEPAIGEQLYGAREPNTTLHWKTLDACLSTLMRA